jgi:hypothetical protein
MTQPAWIQQLFRSIDAMDTNTFITFLADDSQFKFGNAPPAVGKEAVYQAVDGFFKSIKGIRHTILKTWDRPDAVACQGEVTYTRLDDSEITLPFVNVFGMKGNLIKDYLVYIDVAPLFGPSK